MAMREDHLHALLAGLAFAGGVIGCVVIGYIIAELAR